MRRRTPHAVVTLAAVRAKIVLRDATRAAGHGVAGTTARDPVGAFGPDELTAGAAAAGITADTR